MHGTHGLLIRLLSQLTCCNKVGCSCSKQEEMYHTCTPRFALLHKSIQPYNFNYSKASSYRSEKFWDARIHVCCKNLELHNFMMILPKAPLYTKLTQMDCGIGNTNLLGSSSSGLGYDCFYMRSTDGATMYFNLGSGIGSGRFQTNYWVKLREKDEK